MDTLALIGTILGSNIITNGVNSLITWALAKKRYNSEVDANIIENMKQSLEFYTKLCDDTACRLQEVLKRNEELNAQVLSLQQEILDIYKYIGVKDKEELGLLKKKMDKKKEAKTSVEQ